MSESTTGHISSCPAMCGPAGVAGQLACDGGDVGPRAPAGDGELAGDAAQLDGVGVHPLHGREGVQRGGGEASLGGVAVIHRHDHRARARAEVPA